MHRRRKPATSPPRRLRRRPRRRRRSRSRSTSTASRTASSPCPFPPAISSPSRSATRGISTTSAAMAADASLNHYDLAKRKNETPLASADAYTLSADAKKVLYAKDRAFFITLMGPKIAPGEGRIAAADIEVRIDPRAEWAQIFNEAWRINRDYFYAPNMHGVDWPAMKAKYAAFLPDLATRGDLNRVVMWMCSELAVGHHRTGGGDRLEQAKTVPGGLLGADYEVANGRYRFTRVLGGLNWTPELRSPLTEPGVDVKAGEYLIAVNGRDVRPPANLYSFFENTSGKIVELTVGPNADGSGSRTVQAVPDRVRVGASQPRLGRGQPQEGRQGHRRPRGVRLRAEHRGGRPHLLQALLLSAVPQGRRHRRRALQRRRLGGRLLHRHPPAAVHQQLGHAVRRRPEDANVDPGPEGDDHRRDGRLRRRPAAVDVPEVQARAARGPAHVGRPRRDARVPGADGRRRHHGPEPRHLGARRGLGRGERGRGAGHRSGADAGRRDRRARPATREGHRGGDGRAEEGAARRPTSGRPIRSAGRRFAGRSRSSHAHIGAGAHAVRASAVAREGTPIRWRTAAARVSFSGL